MRINIAGYLLLACMAAAFASPDTPRSKRHLQQWKDAILSKFFGNKTPTEENVRFYRIPGHDNILVKAVPKMDTIETAVVAPVKLEDANPTIAILKSYLGTKSASETLSALQGVRHLLQSGILRVQHEPSEIVPFEKSAFLVPPFISEKIELFQPRPATIISGPPKIPLIPVLPPAAEAPQVIEEIIPIKAITTTVPELIPYPKFLYKQVKKDGSIVTYTVKDEISSDVIVSQTNKPMPRPPSFIVDRLRKAFLRHPLSSQSVPVRLLPPLPSPVTLNPSFDIYSASAMPPIHTALNIPRGEVHVQTYPGRNVHIDDKLGSFINSADNRGTGVQIIAEEPAILMPPSPPFIVDRIDQNLAALSTAESKFKRPAGFQIVNKEDYIIEQELLRNPGHVFYNPPSFAAPLTSEYGYRPPSLFKANPFNVVNVNNPTYVSKGAVAVKVNKNHMTATKPNNSHYQQFQHDNESTFLSDGLREARPIELMSKPVQQMPVPPVHIIKRIQNVASKAHSTPKISRAYAFKINNPPYINFNNKESPDKLISNKFESVVTKPLMIRDKQNLGSVYFAESELPFSYVYRLKSQTNPQSFTVGQTEDNSTYKPVEPPCCSHEHERPDGTTYKCKKNHVLSQFPEDFYYVPPLSDAEVHIPTTHTVEKLENVESQFSFVQVTNNGVYTNKNGTAAFSDGRHINVKSSSDDVNVTTGSTPSKNSEAFSDNPIVVPETTYSFSQIHSDGTVTNVRGDSGTLVTVNVSESSKSSFRGDIPEVSE